jgi:hypothetical protein
MPHECPPLADVQHAFEEWLAESSSRFSIPLLIRRRRDGSLRMRLSTLWPIPVCLHSTEINVPIVAYSYFLDFLYCNDLVSPKEVKDGYVCKHCLPEAQKLYPSREALWREHLFEDLLDWVNGKVAKSDAVGLFGEPERMTWASLLPVRAKPGSSPMHVLALR